MGFYVYRQPRHYAYDLVQKTWRVDSIGGRSSEGMRFFNYMLLKLLLRCKKALNYKRIRVFTKHISSNTVMRIYVRT